LDSTQIYLAISSFELAPYSPMIEIRNPALRTQLGFPKKKRFFSLADLEASPLEAVAQGPLRKQQDSEKLDESEKAIVEAYSQMYVFRQIATGEHLARALDFSLINAHPGGPSEMSKKVEEYRTTLAQSRFQEAQNLAVALVADSKKQQVPELFTHYIEKLDTEILFFDLRPFLWSAILCLLGGLLLALDVTRKKFAEKGASWIFTVAALPIVIGLGIRVYITQFSPITNMYGTMIWVAFGVILFAALLHALYKNSFVSGILLIGSGLILLLTENIPLILSPDMDPIVAVLRSNFWLSTHVTTITISYAAFTIAMLIGNVTLVRSWFRVSDEAFAKEYFRFAYRMVQLGCFLLTVGIILGGVWADYSWGRFWGWDPKETWALIADLGFLVLLHARLVGWLNEFTFLALCPVAYLLVIMAWYGVNFILAAGLHSYGFSSGGAAAVAFFVGAQLLLLALSLIKRKFSLVTKK
ncbi:MAG: cytochrome c biogenesis protein, partial [Pseudobdellovibrionaceae bacterium]